jgi:tetratricopeptide (TPR) repeat protein
VDEARAACGRSYSYCGGVALSARELIFGRPDRLKVFISAKMASGALKDERVASAEVVERFEGMSAWYWERDATAGSYYSVEECIGEAQTSDALVLILEDDLTEVTRKEFQAARRGGANLIVLVRAGVMRSRTLTRFIDRERGRGAVTKPWSNIAELRTVLFDALREMTVRPVRERIVDRRRSVVSRTRAYDDLDVCVGEDEDSLVPLSAAIDETRKMVATGQTDEAFGLLYDYCGQALATGMPGVARHLVEDLRDIVPAEAIDDEREAWVLNLQGRAMSASGEATEAGRLFERMRQIGRELDDPDIESTALQNLGVQAILAEDRPLAGRLCRQAFDLKRRAGDDYGTLQVLLNHVNVLAGSGDRVAARRWLDEVDALFRGGRMADLRVTVLGQRAQLHIDAGELQEGRGLLLESLRLARRIGRVDRELTSTRNLARLDHDRGDTRRSVAWARKAVELAESLGDLLQEEMMRRALGAGLMELGETDEAVIQFVRAADLAQDLDDAYHHAESLGNAAVGLVRSGRPEDAIRVLDTALSENAGADDAWRARQLGNLASAYVDAGEPGRAIENLRRAAKLEPDAVRRADHLRHAAEIANSDAAFASDAVGLFKEELTVRKSHQGRAEWAWAAAEIGSMLSNSSQAAAARSFFTQALRVFVSLGDAQRAFMTRNDRAIAAAHAGDLRSACKDMNRCLQDARATSDRAQERQALYNLAEFARRDGRDADAESNAYEALHIARQGEDLADEAASLIQCAVLDIDAGRLEDAERRFAEGVRVARTARQLDTVADAQRHLAGLHLMRGRPARAARIYRQALRAMDSDVSAVIQTQTIGGLVVADARRGKVDEGDVQRLVDASQSCGGEARAAIDLAKAAEALLSARKPAVAAELLAVSIFLDLVCASTADCAGEIPDNLLDNLWRLLVLADRNRQRSFAIKLKSELEAQLGDDFMTEVIDSALEVAQEMRAADR